MSTQTIEETREALKAAETAEDQALVKVLRDKLSSMADAVEPEKPARRSKKS